MDETKTETETETETKIIIHLRVGDGEMGEILKDGAILELKGDNGCCMIGKQLMSYTDLKEQCELLKEQCKLLKENNELLKEKIKVQDRLDLEHRRRLRNL